MISRIRRMIAGISRRKVHRPTMNHHLIEAERFYIPWLYDLAVLQTHFVDKESLTLHPSYVIPIWQADGSDAFSESIPTPELLLFVMYTHSFLEKGLKYLCVISDRDASYSQVESFRHRIEKAWRQLKRTPTGASLEATLRDRNV